MRKFLFGLILPLLIYGQVHKTPEEIQEELNTAEKRFQYAKEMFNPWYAGPLITPSATMMPPGEANIQPYLIVTGNYGRFNQDRKSVGIPNNSYNLVVTVPVQIGITDSTDLVVNPTATMNWQNHQQGGGFNDLYVGYGFSILKQTLYLPKIKFTIAETFPTGKCNDLSTNGLALNATGGGSYQTQFCLTMGKLIWWTYPCPMNTRLYFAYVVPSSVTVTNFNNYGGGFGTKGTVRPGNVFKADLGLELSFTQRWVFALDLVYSATNATKFHGNPGKASDGTPAVVGSPYNDSLSLAPAIEYNFSESLEILWGTQFSVYGRNSSNYVNGQFSVEYQW